MNRNYDLFPKQWIQEYIETNPGFDIFFQRKVTEALASQSPPTEPVIKVTMWDMRRLNGAAVYYVAKDDLLSLYSLLEGEDVSTVDITHAAASKLGLMFGNMAKVAPYYGTNNFYGGDGNAFDLSRAFYVSKANLVDYYVTPRYNLQKAMQLHNSPVAKYLIDTVVKDWSGGEMAASHRSRMIPSSLVTEEEGSSRDHQILIDSLASIDDPKIYQQISDLSGWFDKVDTMAYLLNAIAKIGRTNIIQYLTETCPDQVQAVANLGSHLYETPIYHAIIHGHGAVAKIILQYTNKDTILARSHSERSLLYEAVCYGKEQMVELLLTSPWINDLIESVDTTGLTALHRAATGQNYQIFRQLHDAYARAGKLLTSTITDGYTAFHTMVKNRNVSMIRQFVNDIGSVSPITTAVDNYNQTVLHWAAHNGPHEIIDILYEIFAQRNALLKKNTENKYTFFMVLTKDKHTGAIKQLVERPDFDPRLVAETDYYNQTPMMWAINHGLTETCELIYEHELVTGSLLTRSHAGYNALIFTALKDLVSVANLLTNDLDLCDQQMIGDINGYTALHHASNRSPEVCARIYEQSRVDKVCMQTTKHKLTALHIAVLYRCTDMVHILLSDPVKARALVWILDADGCTALDNAWAWCPEMAKCILEAGTREFRRCILSRIEFASLSLLYRPHTSRSELIRFKHSGDIPLDALAERTRHICCINPESIDSRIDDLTRM